jgi:hypothetical protein
MRHELIPMITFRMKSLCHISRNLQEDFLNPRQSLISFTIESSSGLSFPRRLRQLLPEPFDRLTVAPVELPSTGAGMTEF